MNINRRGLLASLVALFALPRATVARSATQLSKTSAIPHLEFDIKPSYLTPAEHAARLPHDLSQVTASVTGLSAPLRVEVAAKRCLPYTKRPEVIEAWHVEVMKGGSRRVWLTNGEFHSYAATAHFDILPGALRAGDSSPLRQLSVYRDF